LISARTETRNRVYGTCVPKHGFGRGRQVSHPSYRSRSPRHPRARGLSILVSLTINGEVRVPMIEDIMPSPFPGMDPYLEGSLWMTVHTQLSAEIARQLAPKLRPKYLAFTTERLVFVEPESVAIATASAIPDVGVLETGRQGASGGGAG